MKLSTFLYKAARTQRDLEVITSGSPRRVSRRAKNKVVGRALAKAGFFRWLWG